MRRALGQSRSAGALAIAVVKSLRGAALNPLLWSILAGILFGLSGLAMPAPLGKTIALLSDAASPVALFTIGAILARNALSTERKTPVRDYLPLAFVKLLAHPLFIFLGLRGAQAMGFPLDAQTAMAIMLIAALPSASNVSMLARALWRRFRPYRPRDHGVDGAFVSYFFGAGLAPGHQGVQLTRGQSPPG